MAEGRDPVQSLVKSPATPTLQELSNALYSVVDWHSLGVKLGLKDHELSIIDKNFHREGNERCKHEMLSQCLRNDKIPTWKAVTDALQLMGERDVALKILNEHSMSSNTTDTGTPLAITSQDPSRAAVAQRNIIMIQGKFAMLVTKSRKRLQYREIDVEDIQIFLVTMYSSPNSRDGTGMVITVLESAKSLGEIFRTLGKYGLWNYLNYSLLQSIIKEFAHDDKELNDMMEEYQQDLTGHILTLQIQTYLDATNHSIATSNSDNLADEVIPHELFEILTAKCKVNVTDHTLSYVNCLWESLAKQFKLPRPAMILHKVAEGCIGITWLIPANLVKYVTRMAQEGANMFAEENILRVTLAKQCIYSVETKLVSELVTEPTPLDSEPPGLKTAALKGGGGDRGLDLPGERSLPASDHSPRKSPQQEGRETEKDSALLSYTGSLTTPKYHELESQFTKLYLSNEHEQLQELSQQTLDDKSISADIKVFALCWQALSEAVHQKYKPAERLLKCALKKAKQPECENALLLQGRVLRHFAHFQYVQGHNDEAEKYMLQANKILSNAAPSNETALALYTELRMKRHTLYNQRKPFSSQLYMSIEKEYERLLEHAESMEDYEKPVVFNFFTMKASFHLRSELITDKLPPEEYWPSADDLRKAEECLNKVSPDIMPSQNTSYTARYYRTHGDLHMWKHFEQYSQAMCYLEKARKLYDEMRVRQNNPLDRVVQQIELLEKVKSHKMHKDYDTALTTFGEM